MLVVELGGLYPGDRVVFGVIGAITITLLLGLAIMLLWRGFSLRRESVDSLRSAGTGDRVRLEGGAERIGGRTETAPLSGHECLACQVEARRQEGDDTKEVSAMRDGVPFVISTDDGDVLLAEGEAFDLLFEDDREVIDVGPNERRPERLNELIRSADDFGPIDELVPSRMYYVETRLLPGETVFVEGVLDDRLPDGSSPPRGVDAAITAVDSRWYHLLFPKGPSLLSDMPHSETSRYFLGRGGEILGASVFVICLALVLGLRLSGPVGFALGLVGLLAIFGTVGHAVYRTFGTDGVSNLPALIE